MEMTATAFFTYVIGFIVILLIVAYVTRTVFSIPKIIKQNEAQIALLALIAEKLNAEPHRISDIMDHLKKSSGGF